MNTFHKESNNVVLGSSLHGVQNLTEIDSFFRRVGNE